MTLELIKTVHHSGLSGQILYDMDKADYVYRINGFYSARKFDSYDAVKGALLHKLQVEDRKIREGRRVAEAS